MGAGSKVLVEHGQVWRLLSVMLLHGSFLHLAFNMLALLSFGAFLEKFLGWRRYLILYVVSGLGGSALALLRSREVMSVGASGGIWGLMVAGAVLVTWPRERLPAVISAAQRQRAWTPVLINGFYSFTPGIDWLAHLGGGLTGGILVLTGLITAGIPLAAAAGDATKPPLRETIAVRVFALLSGAALGLSILVAWARGRPWELQQGPHLSRVEVGKGGFVEMPRLVGPSDINEKTRVWSFGGLAYDPVAFVMSFPSYELSEHEAAQPAEFLKQSTAKLNGQDAGMKDFAVTTPFALADNGGTPYLHSRRTAPDGRFADLYCFILGKHMAYVMAIVSPKASDPWKDAAAKVPFTLTLP
jgi:hypothetical protein